MSILTTLVVTALPLSFAPADTVPLYDNLGDHHRTISTSDPVAQRYFDQGLRLQYAFNHAEAIGSYEEALGRDPGCAMCWWGIALASGPNINAPMDSAAGARAHTAILEARRLMDEATETERALIDALTRRYGTPPLEGRVGRDSAYARAMEGVAADNPDDADVLALYAASLMNLRPWDYWSGEYGERVPNPGTEEILAALERALAVDSQNPGACHYYIHAVEAAHPERAVECADRLAALMPGAGHIVHMPGHIYIRVGRYADAVRANEHAVHSDETYIADRNPTGLYPTAYYPHNYHFMNFAASMAGMGERAMEAARTVAPKVPPEVADEIYWVQNVLVLPALTGVTFGRWDEVLDQPMPAEDLETATALAHYARGVALAATDRAPDARAELQRVRAIRAADEADAEAAEDEPNPVIAIADEVLAGEIALRTGAADRAVERFRAAAAIEDGMIYEEPPLWYYPVRHSLGRALLEAGRPEEAERTYREDLQRFPDNGWSLHGLAASLEAQGTDAAAAVRARFEDAWSDADVELTASRF